MKELKDRIIRDGVIKPGNILKVDSFLNHQIDVKLFNAIGKEFKQRFQDKEVNKILTIEASGIGIACIVAQYFDVPVVFAKKNQTKQIDNDVYVCEVTSYTHGRTYNVVVAKEYLNFDDKVLIIDDFLANGNALKCLINIVNQAKASVIGCGIVIEKGFQPGGKELREAGYQVESLAIIDTLDDKTGTIDFRS